MRLIAFIVLSCILSIQLLIAQTTKLSISNKKAIALYEKAIAAYDNYDHATAISLLTQSIKKSENFIEAYLMLSQIYQEQRDYDNSIIAAEKAIGINPDYYPNIHFNLGNMFLVKGEYQHALEKFNKFKTYKTIRTEVRYITDRKIQQCEFALNSITHPVDFKPENLGPNINSRYDDYWPSLSADENTLVITSNVPRDTSVDIVLYNRQEDFFVSHRDSEGQWEKIKPVGYPLNTVQNEGAQSITSDGKTMYFTQCKGVCSIYRSNLLSNGKWDKPVKLPKNINHERFSSKQPSISPDGRTLYFVSNRPGGIGDFDIWKSTLNDNWEWGNPVNLGRTINTQYLEQSPFIHFDNRTLYFSSDGFIGMGGLDIYVSHLQDDSTWSEPKNLGYPINTFRDEDGLIVNAKGTTAYYSSDRGEGSHRDIFTFRLNPDVQPTPVSYLSGLIFNTENHEPVRADFTLVNLKSGKETMKSLSNFDGSFLVCIPTDESYAFFASAPGYLFYSDHFDIKGQHTFDKPFLKDIGLKPIKVNELIVMRNIFFKTDSFELEEESMVELSKLFTFLANNPTLKVEIGGHTDNSGSDDYNQKLSEMRAKSVASYLISKNIAIDRITWKGYGETCPVSSNDTDNGKADNRRTEVKIVGV